MNDEELARYSALQEENMILEFELRTLKHAYKEACSRLAKYDNIIYQYDEPSTGPMWEEYLLSTSRYANE